MAIGRLNIRVGHKGKALAHYNYISASGKYHKKSQELLICQSGFLPEWAKDNPEKFWEASDLYERANGSVYREHILSLPREFTVEQNLELLQDWINDKIVGQPFTAAVHIPIAQDGKEQPHCHLMFCDRKLDDIQRTEKQFFKRYNSKDPSKGGAKKLNTGMSYSQRQTQIKQIRQDWGDLLNAHLLKNGFEPDVDMRNWQERGLDAPPINLSLAQIKLQKRLNGLLNDRVLPKYHLPQKNALETITERNRASKDDGLDQEKQKQADLTPKPKPPAPKPF